MTVKGNHPLAEVIAKRLFGIETVPEKEQRRMVNRACKDVVEYHENIIKTLYDAQENKMITKSERLNLRETFEQETGISYINIQDEIDIDYVEWLETLVLLHEITIKDSKEFIASKH